jgi:hypothetical protein
MVLGDNAAFLGSQTVHATFGGLAKRTEHINGFILVVSVGENMVEVVDPNSGEWVRVCDAQFTEAGFQRHEINSGDGDILVVEIKHFIKPAKPLYHRKDWLEEEYIAKNRTMAEIANQFGITPMSIHQWLGKHGIPTRPRGRRT